MKNLIRKILNENFDWVNDVPLVEPWDKNKKYVLDVQHLNEDGKEEIVSHMTDMGYFGTYRSDDGEYDVHELQPNTCYLYFETFPSGTPIIDWNTCDAVDPDYGGSYKLITKSVWDGMMDNHLNENFDWVDEIPSKYQPTEGDILNIMGDKWEIVGFNDHYVSVNITFDGDETREGKPQLVDRKTIERLANNPNIPIDLNENFDWVGDIPEGLFGGYDVFSVITDKPMELLDYFRDEGYTWFVSPTSRDILHDDDWESIFLNMDGARFYVTDKNITGYDGKQYNADPDVVELEY